MRRYSVLSLLLLMGFSQISFAQDLAQQIKVCSEIKADGARLTCFDGLVKSSEVKAPPIVEVVKQTQEQKIADFGAAHLKAKKQTSEEQKIVLTVAEVKKNHRGKLRFVFENGQRWKQTDGLRFNIKVGDSVIITKGALGAFYLKKNKPDVNSRIRVKRTK